MKAVVLAVTLALVSASGKADDLSDANKLFDAKSYPQALALYAKLAEAGNAEAQMKLGEMYWYGEAGSVDMAKADAWFRKAAAAGNKAAQADVEMVKQHDARTAEIAVWTTSYNGSELTSGKFSCKAPSLPAVSHTNDEIKQVNASYGVWLSCYNDFVKNLNDAMPPGKRIPPDLAKIMNQQEYDAAVAHLDKLYAKIAGDARLSANITVADHEKWRVDTEAWVKEQNRIAEDRMKQYKDDVERAAVGQDVRMNTPIVAPNPSKK